MRRLQLNLKALLSKAVQRAYPVTLPVSLGVPKPSQNCDFVSQVPGEIFDKYQKEGVCYGLFNAREVADGVFVHIERSPLVRKVKVNGLGELELTLEEGFLETVLEEINGKFEIERSGKSLEGVNLMMDWRSFSSACRAGICAETIIKCLKRANQPSETRIYGEIAQIDLSDPTAMLSIARSVLNRNTQASADFVRSKLPSGKSFIHCTDISLKPVFAQFQPIHIFSSIFDPSGNPISADFNPTPSDILKIQATSPILPVQITPADDQNAFHQLSSLLYLPSSANPIDTYSTRRLSVLLAQYSDIIHETPVLGPTHLASYVDSIVQTIAPIKSSLSPKLAYATAIVAAEARSLLGLPLPSSH